MRLLRGFLVCLIMQRAINAQFLEQPDAGTVFVPVQDEVTLICSVEEGYRIDWLVGIPGGPLVWAANMIVSNVLTMERNFTLEGVETSRSTLSLRQTDTQTNNGTNITCCIAELMNDGVAGNTVTVIFYDIPPPPTNLSVTENELGSLNISWSLGFIEGVPVNYTLTVLNLNTTSAQPIIIAGLLDQHYVFETSRPCDVYSYTVTAVTAAGNSTPSQEIIFSSVSSQCICSCSTITEDKNGPITSSTQLTTVSSTVLTTTSFSHNSTIIVSVVFAVLLSVSVLGNVIMCARYYKKKTKTVITSDLPDPVYETPKNVTFTSAETPFAMTKSSVYGVSHPQVKTVPTTFPPSS